ncbi:MAG: hypothetical protein VR65_07945 [Desulfobulbaceae bacterium BRH_c16a]|nr:MAG: hypothetical protein VR65_07945 [Desulfobulbaceae bacterium BRH_c16a]
MSIIEKFRLDNKVVLITGGGGLLGKSYAQAIHEVGGIPIIADLANTNIAQTAKIIGPQADSMEMDVSDKQSIKVGFEYVATKYGRLDGLINNAAYNAPATSKNSPNFVEFEDFPYEVWQRSLDVDLSGAFLCAQEASVLFKRQKSGVAVNISSTYGNVAPDQRIYRTLTNENNPSQRFVKPVSYSTTKGAMINFTKYLAVYWAPFGARANCLTLGGVFDNQDSGFVEQYKERTPLNRMAHKDEYAATMVYLLSEASSYMTGSNLVIDGGWTAW